MAPFRGGTVELRSAVVGRSHGPEELDRVTWMQPLTHKTIVTQHRGEFREDRLAGATLRKTSLEHPGRPPRAQLRSWAEAPIVAGFVDTLLEYAATPRV